MFRSPASLAANVAAIGRFSRGPIVIPGDLLQGGADTIVGRTQAEALPGARTVMLDEAGHFDLIHPYTPAFGRIRALLEELLNDAP